MIEKYTIHSSILSQLINRVNEDNLPIHLITGKRQEDYNGDVQVDVLVEFDDCDAGIFHRILNESVETYCLSFNN
ncbi:hypothetical protein [Phocaeicola sartorii]|uniref:hypothetical protein n=1 Tax=Phocaeicola sartorii TaxID=671267 RepID=UPI003519922E